MCSRFHTQPIEPQLAELPQQALDVYNKALASFKDSHQVLNNLGNLQRQMGELEEAMASYRACIKLKGDYALAYNNLALIHVLRQVRAERECARWVCV